MSGRKPRQAKGSIVSPLSSGSAATEEDSCHSPRLGRKEAEHKRRVVENQYYDELTALLSMISERSIMKKMDKVTTLKEAVMCIKVYYDLAQRASETLPIASQDTPKKAIKSPSMKSPVPHCFQSPHLIEALPGLLDCGQTLGFFLDAHDSFLMIFTESGRILFTTELVTSLLGQMQSRLVGQNIYDYVHTKHKRVIQGLFIVPKGMEGKSVPNSPLVAYPSRPFTAHFKLYTGETSCVSQYLPFVCLSFLRHWTEGTPVNSPLPRNLGESSGKKACVIVIGKLPTSMTLMDLAVSTNEVNFEFEMRISREGRIMDVDKHAVMVFGFSTSELIGTLLFEYIDPYHITDVGDSMSRFLGDGIGTTKPYRIRTKGGRCIWLVSKGYLSYDPWNNKLNHILLANRVLGCDQVLPEHRFFQSNKHLPDQEGKECYIPDLEDTLKHPKAPDAAAGAVTAPNLLQSRATPSCTSSVVPKVLISDSLGAHPDGFVRVSAGGSVGASSTLSPLRQRMDLPSQVFSEGAEGGGGGCGENPSTRGPSGAWTSGGREKEREDTGKTHEQFQRELEEKSLQLLDMQRKLMEQEQQFNRDRMQFFKAAQSMMQELSSGVGGGGGREEASLPLPSPVHSTSHTLLDSTNKNVSSPGGPLAPSTPAALNRGDHRNYAPWGKGATSMPTDHLSQQNQTSDRIAYINSPTESSTSPADITGYQHSPSHNFNPPSSPYINSPYPPDSPVYGGSLLSTPDDSRYHSPLNCLPYTSLDEHNMQFYQQQQQQQTQQQQRESMYSPVGRGLLVGNSTPSMANGLLGGNVSTSVSSAVNSRRYPNMMLASTDDDNLDLADILNSTSSFST